MSFLSTSVNKTYDHPVYEGYSHEDGGASLIIMESYQDSQAVIESLSELDLHILKESNTAVLEASVKDILGKVKSGLQKLWGKLKAFFASIVRYFDGLTKSAAEFAKKYEKELTKRSLSDFKFKMYNYTIPAAPEKDMADAEKELESIESIIEKSTKDSTLEDAKDALVKARENKEELEEEARGAFTHKGGKLTAEEYRKDLFSYFRGGAEGKEDKEEISVEIHAIISAVKDSPKLKRAVEAAAKATDASFGKYLKNLDAAAKKVEIKDGEGSTNSTAMGVFSGAIRLYSTQITFLKGITAQFFNAWIDAVKERDRTYKSVMQAAFRHKEA